ncbi:MAG: hypothetical protein JEY79_11035 [Pseudodesulfovibrio sp.]|nr:hypothetical protein [Pseudodesulfovibrio sp.]
MKIRILDHDYDQFLLGTGPSGEQTLIHLGNPQFVCKIADNPVDVPEEDFIHMLANGRTLHSLALLAGELNTPEDFTALMAEAESAIKRING